MQEKIIIREKFWKSQNTAKGSRIADKLVMSGCYKSLLKGRIYNY